MLKKYIKMEELEIILKHLRQQKAPEGDKLNVELSKYAERRFNRIFLILLSRTWRGEPPPPKLAKSNYDNKSHEMRFENCEHYRGISLFNFGYNIYPIILEDKL
jgi:hypothetical protein